jgi:phosphotriesterase-related protein
MATVEGVNGPIDADDLGRTLIHEHFRSRDEAVTVQFPHVRDEEAEYEAALEQARGVVEHGVRSERWWTRPPCT